MAKTQLPRSLRLLLKKGSVLSYVVLLSCAALYAHLAPTPLTLPEARPSVHPSEVALYATELNDPLTDIYATNIAAAAKSITLAIYSLSAPQLITLLNEKQQQGIKTHFVCDAKACAGLSKRLHIPMIRRAGPGLMHQKIVVVDEKKIILGSANLTPSSLSNYGNLVMVFEDPILAQALEAHVRQLEDAEEAPVTPSTKTLHGTQEVELWILPSREGADRVKALLQAAKKSIKIAMFTWTRTDFTEELIAAKNRGVEIVAVIDKYSGKGASAKVVKMLQKHRIPVRFSTGKGLLHHKFAYIDDTTLINGSANWTYSAFEKNDDVMMILSPLTASQKHTMRLLWNKIEITSAQAPTAEER